MKEVVTFDSVEEFWGIYVCSRISFLVLVSRHECCTYTSISSPQNNITKTSDLALKSDYHLFKAGVRPEWEDIQNKHGGKWSYQFKDKRAVPIDELWLHVMLAAIGETLESENDKEIMGVVVNVRKAFFRIGLWTKSTGGGKNGNGATREALMEIGRKFKEVLRLNDKDAVEFSGHTESAHSGSSRAKAKFVV